ncbi:MAG: class I SAM-dependent methyltransferase [Patescibacteria group bacterium]
MSRSHQTLSFSAAEWALYAECYDALTHIRPYQELVRAVHELVPKTASNILDVGCGTGTLLSSLSDTHPNSQLTGIDPTTAMLEQARRKLQNRAELIKTTTAEAPEQFREAFDVVISCNVLYATPNPEAFLSQIRNFLVPGGVCIIATPKKGFDNGLIAKAHCNDSRADDYWLDPHSSPERERHLVTEAFGTGTLSQAMINVAYFNRKIAATTQFHFLLESELETLFQRTALGITNMSLTYAKQTHLIKSHRKETA